MYQRRPVKELGRQTAAWRQLSYAARVLVASRGRHVHFPSHSSHSHHSTTRPVCHSAAGQTATISRRVLPRAPIPVRAPLTSLLSFGSEMNQRRTAVFVVCSLHALPLPCEMRHDTTLPFDSRWRERRVRTVNFMTDIYSHHRASSLNFYTTY